ncbi:MAG: AlkA N-terminal domain-containing protein [Pseudomonadota bacterium]
MPTFQHPQPLGDDACYLALKARDARFDGCFFTGVRSTGIYCRPVCKVRTPRRENCTFFSHAAQAEQAGFRPCLRCRPELAPRSPALARSTNSVWSAHDASGMLARQAAALLDSADVSPAGNEAKSLQALALRLGVSERHVRRIFEASFGVSPLQYLQTRRLLTAKQLLADTNLPVTQVALMSGFGSVRRFNAAFAAHYRLNPGEMRRQLPSPASAARAEGLRLRLGFRPPYDTAAVLGFLGARLLPGVEALSPAGLYSRTLRAHTPAGPCAGWIEVSVDSDTHQLELRVSDSLCAALPQVVQRVRDAFDLDAEPGAIEARLGTDFPGASGLRVPGTVDGFELAVRAVLGQQITVAAARTLAGRLVTAFGEPLACSRANLTHLFPTATALAQAGGDALGRLGIVRQRQTAIVAMAQAVASGSLRLDSQADVSGTLAQLTQMPGIGDWTAQYIAMRALRWPDAFPAGDVALHKAFAIPRGTRAAAQLIQLASRWQPWRSYAVVRGWYGAYRPNDPSIGGALTSPPGVVS